MKGIIASVFLCFTAGMLLAQEVVFQVVPAAAKVGVQDPFEVRYVIRNANRVQSFALSQMQDVQVLGGPSRSDIVSTVNGERSIILELTYVFKAKRKGQVKLPVGVIGMDGREFSTPTKVIEATEGSVRTARQARRNPNPFDDPFFTQDPFGDDMLAAMQKQHQQMMQMMARGSGMVPVTPRPSGAQQGQARAEITRENLNQNLFIRVDVDKHHLRKGEQLTASYKLYTRVPMEINLTRLPSLIGFWNQDFKLPRIPKPRREIVNGKEYQVFEIKRTALFPTQTGTLELDAAEAEGIARILKPKRIRQENPFENDPFFEGFFGSMLMSDPAFDNQYATVFDYEDVQVHLKSSPVKIDVQEIPAEGQPASFNGAVGSFTLESTINKTDLSTDDVGQITLKIIGSGNLKLVGAPNLVFPEGIDAFDIKEKDTITNTDNIIAGYKTFEYSFTPRTSGQHTIPSAEFSFFDSESGTYKTLQIPSYTLNVKQGKEDDAVASGKVPHDIHDINTENTRVHKRNADPITGSPFYWGGFALPALAYIGLLAFKRKEDKLQQDETLFKNKRANKVALKRLETAERYLKLSAQNSFYEETSKAVWLYLSDKLSIPLAALSKEVAAQKLAEHKLPESIREELFRVTGQCEMALYAPDSGVMKMHQTYNDAYRLIGKLEDHLA